MIKDFKTYISEGLFDRNQSEFGIQKTDKGIEQIYIPKTKEELYKYIDIAIENAKKDRTYPDVNLNKIDVSELGDDVLKDLFSEDAYTINPDISDWDIKYIPNNFFYNNKKIKEFTIPNSVTSIGRYAFYDCSDLKSITIPNSVTIIGRYAFEGCSDLTSVTISNRVTRIEDGSFYKCSDLTSVTIPNGVTSIGHSAFYKCIGLTSVTIPNSVTRIEDYAFEGCDKLTSVTIPKNCSIKSSSFPMGCKIIIK